MTRINPKTPLSDLINARLSELSISHTELVQRLGFANQSKGLRRFDQFMTTGRRPSHLLKTLPEVLGLDTAQVEAAAAATRQQIADADEAAARERFHSHIVVLTGRQDGKHIPAFVQAFMWGNKVMGLPNDFDGMTSSQQVRQAARVVRKHFRESGGELAAWGVITGYRLQLTYVHAVLLNVNGTLREGFNRDQEPPAPEIQIKGKRLPVGAFMGK